MSFFPRVEASRRRGIQVSEIAAVVFSLVLSAIPAASQESQPEDQPKSIHGTVINSVTKNPVSRALVMSADNRFAAITDSEGRFEFMLPKGENETQSNNQVAFYRSAGRIWPGGGQIWLRARKPGFLEPGSWRDPIVRASPGADVTIEVVPEALIRGRVTLSTGDVANNLVVELFTKTVSDGLPRWTPGVTVRANSAGEFRFPELHPGSYKLVTHEWIDNDPIATTTGSQLYGYPPVYYPAAADFSVAGAIELTAGETVEADMSLTRQAYYPVRIPVATEDIGGGVRVSVQGQHGPGYELGFNMGVRRIEGMLPNGTYAVTASTFGETAARGQITLVVAGRPAETAPMALNRNSSIHINVKEEFHQKSSTTIRFGNGTPLHGPRAYLQAWLESVDEFDPGGNGGLRPPQGPNDDSLVLENVAPGRYWLHTNTGEGYLASVTMGTADLLREPIAVAEHTNPSIEIVLRDDGAEIEGTVTDIANRVLTNPNDMENPFPQARVYCIPLPDSPGQFQQIGISQEGKFQHQMLAPGSYRILAFATAQPFLPYRDSEAIKAYESKGQVVNLTAGQKTTVEVQLIPGSD